MTDKDKRHGSFSRWMQHRMNARTNRRIRRGRGTFMGMDVLILHTAGRRSGEPRETPVAWFEDAAGGEDTWLVVASGGTTRHPDWHLNLLGRPERASVELPGRTAVPVAARVLDGAERERAWRRVTEAQPRYAKYQSRSDRQYPLVRLTPR
ncbi:nitroreductase family deazaflavin-dependent oxidoreductase [Streptomyces sp. NPDC090106]|uniref:nitroreductase family deazaflavin-dependent oxidoreductase n=1 Tax=Streptomyces sp. NPDC090106 TaxID=3365946 RepID=UPI00381EA691